jgi:hypothetical protein
MPNTSYLLVMTACIDPSNGHVKIKRSNPLLRLQDYETAFRFWLNYRSEVVNKILFIENTGYPLDSLKEIAATENPLGKLVEFISLNCNEYPTDVHYGYAELAMLDEGLPISRLFQDSEYLIKVTGRLVFPSLGRLLNWLPPGSIFAVDCRKNPWFMRSKNEYVTTQLMIFSTTFYRQNLIGIKEKMNQQMTHMEGVIYQVLCQNVHKSGAWMRFPFNVDPQGYPGNFQESYQSPKKRMFSFARAIGRVLLPNWWL